MAGVAAPLLVETRRTCWAYSPGGHLAELERATAGIRFADRFDVTFAGGRPPSEPPRQTYTSATRAGRRGAPSST